MRRLMVGFLALGVLAPAPQVQDWPQWRGPARDGTVGSVDWPGSFESAWRTEVGEGYSSPVVAGGRVFVHSRRDPVEVVTALDAATGQVVWTHDYRASYEKNQYATRMGKGPNATPLVDGGRLFTIGATGVLTAWDAASGAHLWRKDFSALVDLSKLFCGTAASPLMAGGLLVVQVGSDVHGGSIVALDPATGVARWEWRGAGPGYASPILITVDGVSQVVTLTNGSIVAVDAGTGRELWSTSLPNEWHENTVSPVWTGSSLIVSTNEQGTSAYAPAREGGTWRVRPLWKNAELTMHMSTPVVRDGVLYGLSNKRRGSFVALDATTGVVRWQTEGREGENAVVLAAPHHIVFLTDAATLSLVRPNAERFDLDRRYELGTSATWATPAVIGRDVIVRDASGVARLRGRD